jgi:hypothetical protein
MADEGINPGQQGTVFPEMGGGGAPGDQDPGSDITGRPLPPLTPENEGFAAGTGSSLSLVPGAEPGSAGDAPEQVAGAQIDPPQGRRGRSAAERIAQLTKQYRQEQRGREDITLQLNEALGILRQQGEELKALRTGRSAPAASANDAADALGLAGRPTNAGGGADITLDSIRGIVRDTISEYDSRAQQRNSQIEQTKAAHEASFMEAAEEMPELLDQRSTARRHFDELYRTSPLRFLADAPYQIALQVRGILADDARRGATAERKLQAGVVAPAAGPADTLNSRAQMQREYAKLVDQRKRGDDDFQNYKRMMFLRENLKRR